MCQGNRGPQHCRMQDSGRVVPVPCLYPPERCYPSISFPLLLAVSNEFFKPCDSDIWMGHLNLSAPDLCLECTWKVPLQRDDFPRNTRPARFRPPFSIFWFLLLKILVECVNGKEKQVNPGRWTWLFKKTIPMNYFPNVIMPLGFVFICWKSTQCTLGSACQ